MAELPAHTMKVTQKKAAANRANSKSSTGPKTKNGKAAVAKNGLVHGLRSLTPVLPGIETSKAWEEHKNAITGQLDAEGAIEDAPAERVALGFWRLARCVNTEARAFEAVSERSRWLAISSVMHKEGALNYKESPEDALSRLEKDCDELSRVAALWSAIQNGKASLPVETAEMNTLLFSSVTDEEWQLLEDEFNLSKIWPPKTVAGARKVIDWIGERVSKNTHTWRIKNAKAATAKLDTARAQINRFHREGENAAKLAPLNREIVHKLARYETSIHRALIKDLHELQRLQALRSGGNVLAPIAVDVSTDS